MTIQVKYSCHLCGANRITVVVPARGEEDVKVWMDATVAIIGASHRQRSPRCHATHLSELMIPMPAGTDKIGGPQTQ